MWDDQMMWHLCLQCSVSAGLSSVTVANLVLETQCITFHSLKFCCLCLCGIKSRPSFLWGFGGPFEAWSSEYHQDLRGQKHGSAKRDPSYCKGGWLGYNILYRRSISTSFFWWFSHHLRGILEQRLTSLGYLIFVSIDKLTIELKRPEACGESSMSSRQSEGNTWRNRTMQVLQLCDDYASI